MCNWKYFSWIFESFESNRKKYILFLFIFLKINLKILITLIKEQFYMNNKTFRWAICGTGNISHRFLKALSQIDDCEAVACFSSTKERAEEYGKAHNMKPYVYTDKPDLNEFDAVYVCTNNHLHAQNVEYFINHNVPVLVEKPFAVDSAQAKKMIELATSKNVLLMEAMWTAYLPCTAAVKKLVAGQSMGEIKKVESFFTIPHLESTGHRIFKKEYAGGVILDLGVYFISYTYQLFGAPLDIDCDIIKHRDGVELEAKITMKYAGFQAEGICSLSVDDRTCYYNITTERGTAKIPDFNGANKYSFELNYGKVTEHNFEPHVEQFSYQARYFMDLYKNNKKQSDLYPLSTSQLIVDMMTKCRAKLATL